MNDKMWGFYRSKVLHCDLEDCHLNLNGEQSEHYAGYCEVDP